MKAFVVILFFLTVVVAVYANEADDGKNQY